MIGFAHFFKLYFRPFKIVVPPLVAKFVILSQVGSFF